MMQKQMNGRMNEALTEGMPATVPRSIIAPCNGGIKAPPTIAITRKAAPRVLSLSTPSSAIPYIVGNIRLMNADVATRQ